MSSGVIGLNKPGQMPNPSRKGMYNSFYFFLNSMGWTTCHLPQL
jgi:hypothetical protein